MRYLEKKSDKKQTALRSHPTKRRLAKEAEREARLGGFLGLNLLDLLTNLQSLIGETGRTGSEEPSIDTAIMFDGANPVGGQTKLNHLAEDLGGEGANLQIGLPAATRTIVGVADLVAEMGLFAGHRAYTSH